ncbi:hypothetical protein SOVF_089650, partial [Spinacia oleracea]
SISIKDAKHITNKAVACSEFRLQHTKMPSSTKGLVKSQMLQSNLQTRSGNETNVR